MNKNKACFATMVMVILFTMILGGTLVCNAAIIEKDEITIPADIDATITNADGETITVSSKTGLSGTMEVLDEKMTKTTPGEYILTVRSSKSYTYVKKGKGESTLSIKNKDGNSFVMVSLENTGTASISFAPEGRIDVEGPSQKYMVYARFNDGGRYSLEGKLQDKLSVTESGDHIIVNGAVGKATVSIEDPTGKINSEDVRYYFFGGSSTLGYTGKGTYVTNAVKIPDTVSKTTKGLYLRPVNNGKNMFLTWHKVKKAKSYIVYRYDPAKKKCKKEAVRNGQGSNYYVTDSKQKGIYRYKVLAKTGKNGTGKSIGKLSYCVTSVTDYDSKGNVVKTKIRSAKNKMTVKNGKKKKLKADVYGNGKPLYNKNIRWYSSDSKIAGINKKSGKIKAKKKGSCYVWAKAHNGKNSSKLKIVVK